MTLAGLMLRLVLLLFGSFRAALHSRADLVIENLALRQQLAVLAHTGRRGRVTGADRLFWVTLRRLWARWSDVLVFVKPETVIQWHRAGFRRFWTWLSRRRRTVPSVASMASNKRTTSASLALAAIKRARKCHDTTVSLGHSRQRLFLPEALVWPRLVVEAGVLRDEAQKMAFAKHEDMVEMNITRLRCSRLFAAASCCRRISFSAISDVRERNCRTTNPTRAPGIAAEVSRGGTP